MPDVQSQYDKIAKSDLQNVIKDYRQLLSDCVQSTEIHAVMCIYVLSSNRHMAKKRSVQSFVFHSYFDNFMITVIWRKITSVWEISIILCIFLYKDPFCIKILFTNTVWLLHSLIYHYLSNMICITENKIHFWLLNLSILYNSFYAVKFSYHSFCIKIMEFQEENMFFLGEDINCFALRPKYL